MRPNDFRQMLQLRPFHPFRLHLSGGQTYDIRHPELVSVRRSVLWLYSISDQLPRPVSRDMLIVSLAHVVQIEFYT